MTGNRQNSYFAQLFLLSIPYGLNKDRIFKAINQSITVNGMQKIHFIVTIPMFGDCVLDELSQKVNIDILVIKDFFQEFVNSPIPFSTAQVYLFTVVDHACF